MMTLDLNELAVESFPTLDGDPSQWLMLPITATDEEESQCCEDNLYAGAATHERICSTTR